MNELKQHSVRCPYCGESIDVLIDCSVSKQKYIEDCQVCCRPINFDITVNDEGEPDLTTSHEDDY